MARRRKLILTEPLRDPHKSIKVRLAPRTVITLSNVKTLDLWRLRNPKAELIH